jgi:TRAP-type C4-dicarboxylate transport system substrate-binding protein
MNSPMRRAAAPLSRSGLLPGALVRAAAVAAALMPYPASGEPIRLKLSFFGPEQALVYQAGIKPFVDAVNAEGKGLLSVAVYPDGALGKAVADQPALLQKGIADIAWVVPGQTPYRFPDNQIFELPGLTRNAREATLTYTRLVAAKALHGYEDFFVVGAYTTGVSVIHSRKPIRSLAALRGQKIRANNPIEAEVLGRLNAVATVMPVSQVATALERGTIDGAVVALTGFFDFGVADVATYHFLLPAGTAPLALLMNRKKFDSLPDAAKNLIRKYSGEWTAKVWIDAISKYDQESLNKLKSNPKHTVVDPSPADMAAAERVYRTMIENWAAGSERNRALLKRIEAGLAAIRSAPR